jgi:hypothetical protein
VEPCTHVFMQTCLHITGSGGIHYSSSYNTIHDASFIGPEQPAKVESFAHIQIFQC